jgi:large subunit ribosomal protein L24
MNTKWSKTWKSSVQPRKQRKYLANAPLHVKQKRMSVHLDKKLKEKIKRRSIPVRKGDEVKVLRGKRKGTQAKIVAVNTSKSFVYLEGQTRDNIRGTKVLVPFAPSNLLLLSMVDDKRRNRQGKKIVKKKIEVKPEKKVEKTKKDVKAKEVPKTPEKKIPKQEKKK